MKVYVGVNTGPGGQQVFVASDDPAVAGSRRLCQRIIRHSPDGFSWGYAGSGPSDLSLNMLLDALESQGEEGVKFADRHYQEFKFAFIASAGKDLKILESEILEWCDKIRDKEKESASHV